MNLREITDQKAWEKFNLSSKNPSFLQSWSWGEFQKRLGRKIWRFGLFNQSLEAISLVILEKTKTSSFLHIPGGPVFNKFSESWFKKWLEEISKIAKEERIDFVRVDPRKFEEELLSYLKNSMFIPASQYTQPECTALLDLSKNEDTLLAEMTSSTRYNINMSLRKGVKVRKGKIEDIDIFPALLKSTAKKKGLVLPSEGDYHNIQYRVFNKEGLMDLLIAEYSGKALAASLVMYYGERAYYLHAANSYEMTPLRASYPLVWTSIIEAKNRGFKVFDFWGIAPNENSDHPWAGVTAFKMSFGAKRECYDGPFDLPFSKKYDLVRLLEKWRRPIRKIIRFRG